MKKLVLAIAVTLSIAVTLCSIGCDQKGALTNGSANGSAGRDNTAVNTRDRDAATKTPIDQNENQQDINITAEIRKRIGGTKMSTNAQNVKIMTQNGRVTLRGPVMSEDEKKQIEVIAHEVAGATNVDSQIEIVVAR